MFMMRIIGHIITFVNKPWKMYPVGVLFGFGFDTASSIALLAISALCRKGSDGSSIPSGDIVILPLLFTAGMSLVDSADSVLMLCSYAGFPERSWTITLPALGKDEQNALPTEKNVISERPNTPVRANMASESIHRSPPDPAPAVPDEETPISDEKSAHLQTNLDRDLRVKLNVMSGLSIVLTLMSILVAFSISLITIMGLIGDQCNKCQGLLMQLTAAALQEAGGEVGQRQTTTRATSEQPS
ncbi:high-affinity nickel-transport protein-domain-containing protein [Mycena rebaudengoi]|nr:high-affinity nickel-transport protein-domain-containing protein [Mycena rebaudengoi]